MNYFRYKLIEPTGEISSGIAKLPYQEVTSAISHLERDGSTTVYVKKAGRALSSLLELATFRFRRKMPRPFMAEFLNNVSMMLRSGMTLTTALEEAALSSERPDFEQDIRDIIMSIQAGSSFSEAADNYPHVFPKTVVHLIRLGEETGKMDQTLMDASGHLKRIHDIISDTKQALIYPSFVFLSMGGGLIFWFYYVVPKIITLFQEMDVTLPTLTVILLHVSRFVETYILLILGVMILTVGSMVLLYKGERRFRRAADGLLLRLPLSGTIIKTSTLAFVTEYFSLLLNVGIDIIQAMQILKESIRNEVFREKLEEVKEGFSRGEGIADSFKRVPVFPPFIVRMINVGEQSGTLPEQLNYIAQDYRKRLSLLVATMGKMIEPVVLIVAGAMFAVIVGGLFLPIYDLITSVAGR
ncbi:MAG: type II secretion system F family protein [Deltaproteobacteria bacterium]|nr:type II secretion system F family protein [Deltaproteobacteria bacterium]RLB39706.1 MAG: type II secretion system F family protein [Deltaproteobacteria bacterium]